MKWLLPPVATSVADIPSFPAFHRFRFGSLTAKESRNFIQFPLCSMSPCRGLLWLKFISYLSWKQPRKMSLPVRLLVQGDGREPRPCSPGSRGGWCQPLRVGGRPGVTRDLGGDPGRGPPPARWASAPGAGTLGMKKEKKCMTERLERSHCTWLF